MTKKERSDYTRRFEARKTSRIEHLQSGYETVYLNRDPNAVSDAGQGWLPGRTADPNDEDYRDGLRNAASYVEKVIAGLDENDPRGDQLKEVLACSEWT